MKKGTFGPGDCIQTIEFAENLPLYVSGILRRYGHEIDPEEITTPYGTRISSHNLEDGIAIPGVSSHRRDIRREIRDEIGRVGVVFV